MSGSRLTITALDGMPQVAPGDDLAALLVAALERSGVEPRSRDILVVTSKIVSKAEGRYLDLGALEPGERARELALITRKDAHLVEAILGEATEVVRAKPNVLIVATRHGLTLANAGIDQSNLAADDHGRRVLLLPYRPDESAARLKQRLDAHFHADIGVVISDSVGRAWRLGTVASASSTMARVTGRPSTPVTTARTSARRDTPRSRSTRRARCARRSRYLPLFAAAITCCAMTGS